MVGKRVTTFILIVGAMPVVVSTALADDSKSRTVTAAAAATPSPSQGSAEETGETLEEVHVIAKFVATGAESAMKQDIRVLDTPVSVESYSHASMKAIETTNVTDLY